jgi:Anti-sigma factor NepR
LGLKRGNSAKQQQKLYRKMGQDNSGDSGAKPVDARVARRRQDAIGRRLRQMYDDVLSESVPDDFLSFLEEADERKPDNSENHQKNGDGTEASEPAPVGARAMKTEP